MNILFYKLFGDTGDLYREYIDKFNSLGIDEETTREEIIKNSIRISKVIYEVINRILNDGNTFIKKIHLTYNRHPVKGLQMSKLFITNLLYMHENVRVSLSGHTGLYQRMYPLRNVFVPLLDQVVDIMDTYMVSDYKLYNDFKSEGYLEELKNVTIDISHEPYCDDVVLNTSFSLLDENQSVASSHGEVLSNMISFFSSQGLTTSSLLANRLVSPRSLTDALDVITTRNLHMNMRVMARTMLQTDVHRQMKECQSFFQIYGTHSVWFYRVLSSLQYRRKKHTSPVQVVLGHWDKNDTMSAQRVTQRDVQDMLKDQPHKDVSFRWYALDKSGEVRVYGPVEVDQKEGLINSLLNYLINYEDKLDEECREIQSVPGIICILYKYVDREV